MSIVYRYYNTLGHLHILSTSVKECLWLCILYGLTITLWLVLSFINDLDFLFSPAINTLVYYLNFLFKFLFRNVSCRLLIVCAGLS